MIFSLIQFIFDVYIEFYHDYKNVHLIRLYYENGKL